MFNNILRREVRCPDFLEPHAKSLLCGLLHKSPADRLGHSEPIMVGVGEDGGLGEALPPKELMEHPFFKLDGELAWLDCLRLQGEEPPWVPGSGHLNQFEKRDEFSGNCFVTEISLLTAYFVLEYPY